MYASTYFENLMLGLLKGTSIGANSTFYLGLFLSNPGESGSAGTEITYTGYARQQITFAAPTASGTGKMIQNDQMVNFAEATSSAGTVTYVGVFDSLTGGNMYLYGSLDQPLVVQSGVSPVFRAGSVKWIWTGNMSDYYRTAVMNVMRGQAVSGFSPYVALYNGDPNGSGQELSGGNYGRFSVTFSNPTQLSGGSMVQNNNDIISSISTASWGTMTHIALFDAQTGGNMFASMSLGKSYSIPMGTAVGFHTGDLQFTIS